MLSHKEVNVLDVLVRAELHVVVRVHGDEVREDVLAREREVLDDKVDLLIRVLDARDGDVADLIGNMSSP